MSPTKRPALRSDMRGTSDGFSSRHLHMSRKLNKRISTASCAFLLALAAGSVAHADDSEIFSGAGSSVSPNVLLILDTSFSMTTPVTQPGPYDPSTDYDGGGCTSKNVYFFPS